MTQTRPGFWPRGLAVAGLLLGSACSSTSGFSEEQLARLSTLAGQIESTWRRPR
jgi:hypothetical protein